MRKKIGAATWLEAHYLDLAAGELFVFAERLALPVARFAAFLTEMLAKDENKKIPPGVLP